MKHTLLFSLLLAAGCTSEIGQHCPSYQTLSHSYTLNSDFEDLMDSHMDSIRVMKFDENDTYLTDIFIDRPVNRQPTEVAVVGARNTFLSVGGEYVAFEILDGARGVEPRLGVTKLQDVEFHLLSENEIARPTSAMFLGGPVVVKNSGTNGGHTDIPMVEKTKRLTVHLLGASSSYTADVVLGNTTMDYTGRPLPDSPLILHLAEPIAKVDTISFAFDIVRLFADDESGVVNIDPLGAVVGRSSGAGFAQGLAQRSPATSTIPIVSTIMKSPEFRTQADLDRASSYDIVVRATGGVIVVVQINGWEIVNVEI